MSPLTILYFLLASSPVYNNWHHESPIFENEWTHESPLSKFEWTPESSIFGGVESTHFNWLLRKALRSTPLTSTRSILSELSNRFEEPCPMTESVLPIHRVVKTIRRIAEVNPMIVERLLTCPKSRFLVEKMLRTVEPESMLLVEKLISKNVPVYLREKIARRVVKSLLTSSVHVPRRSIVSELYPIESMIESPIFSTLFNSLNVEPMTKILIEKLIRRTEVPEVVLSKIIRRLVKSSIRRSHENVLPIELLSKVNRFEHSPLFFNIEKVAELKSLLSTLFNVESTTPSMWTIRHVVEKLHELVNTVSVPERLVLKKLLMKNVLRNNEELPYGKAIFCNYCENVCESTPFSTLYSKYSKVCTICSEICESSSIFGVEHEHKMIERLVRKVVKASKHSKYSKKEKLCRVCEKVCEHTMTSSIAYSTVTPVEEKICRVCEKVCDFHVSPISTEMLLSSPRFESSPFFGLHHRENTFELKLLKKLVKSAELFGERRHF